MDKKLISVITSILFLAGLSLLITPSFIKNIPVHVLYIKIAVIVLFMMGYLALRSRYRLTCSTDIVVCISMFLLIGTYLNYGLVDDAYISLRYAANFAEGHGLVFNVGEKVEGYTSFLWVFLLGIPSGLGIDTVFMAKIFGIGFGIGTIILVYNLINLIYEENDHKLASANYLILLGTHVCFVYWSFSGMETSCYTFLLLCSVYFMLRMIINIRDHNDANLLTDVMWASIFFSLAAMTRPETYALVPINFLFIFICTPPETRLKFILCYLFVFLALFGSFFMWRYNYYGFIFPNTFYNKVDYSSPLVIKRGIHYLTSGFIPHLMILSFTMTSILKRWKSYKTEEIYLISIFLVQCLATIYVGGDNFGGFRCFVYMVPILLILSFPGFVLVTNNLSDFTLSRFKLELIERDNIQRVTRNIIICFMCIFQLYFFRDTWCGESSLTKHWANVGKWLKIHAKPTDTLATPVLGAMSFYSGLTTYDMLGLTDIYIAHKKVSLGNGKMGHEKFDINYILNKEPTYIFSDHRKIGKEENLKACLGVYKELNRFNLSQNYTVLSASFNGTNFTLHRKRD